jgi:hypothetical protein
MVNRDRNRARIRESARRRVSQPIVAPGAESQLEGHLLQSTCAIARLSLVMLVMIVRFHKEMRLVSLEIPEPNATRYQNLMRQNPKIDQKSCNQIHSAQDAMTDHSPRTLRLADFPSRWIALSWLSFP